jgi:hypothetical protein
VNHLKLAHRYWKENIGSKDIVVDATCGNGQDTLYLAKLSPIALYALDIQPQALKNSSTLLQQELSPEEYAKVHFVSGCHSTFPSDLIEETVQLIVYNLGYLPGGDKNLTTQTKTTLLSLERSLTLLKKRGNLSITCYPGHAEGEKEEQAILSWAKTLDKSHWNVCYHQWINKTKAPSLLLLTKISS